MLTASTFLISTDLISILLSWAIAAALIVTLAVINRRRIQTR